MDRFYVGVAQYGADGFPRQPEPIRERHARETAEMEQRLNEAIDDLMEACFLGAVTPDGQPSVDARTARHRLVEVIAESTALELEHYFEWNR